MYTAKVSFSGVISMSKGEKSSLKDVKKSVIKDLLQAGYIEEEKKDGKRK